PPTPRSTLFPYTTLFRSGQLSAGARWQEQGLARNRHGLVRDHGITAGALPGVQEFLCVLFATGRLDMPTGRDGVGLQPEASCERDRKSTRLNSSHEQISY